MIFNMKSFLLVFLVGIISIGHLSLASSPASATATATATSKIEKDGDTIVTSTTKRNLQDFDAGAWANGFLGELVGGGGGSDSGDDDFHGDYDDDSDDAGWNDDYGSDGNSEIAWGNVGAWDDWLADLMDTDGDGGLAALMNAGGDGGFGEFDFCTIVEVAIGMTPTFGIEADCDCRGDFGSGLEVDCAFNECALGSEICGSVGLNFTFGGPDGMIEASVCADFYEDDFKETCFSYGIDMRSGGTITQTCEASYGGEQCECDIENVCLNLDCSSILPGAAMEHKCQLLSMTEGSDLANWMPDFDIFKPDFKLDAGDVPWETLNYDKLDWDNFNVSAVQWNNSEMMTKSWTDLIGGNFDLSNVGDGVSGIVSSGVCKLMSQVVKLTDELGIEGSCSCDDTDGLAMSCEFSNLCIDVVDVGGIIGDSNNTLCGNVSMNLTFESLAQVDADICIEYSDYPETCYSYPIPVADQSTPRVCTARYGEENCRCAMDENFCMSVDCTDFEPLALTDECQVVSLAGAIQPERLMLGFKVPEEGMTVNDGSLISQSISLGVDESGSVTTAGLWSIALFISVGTTVLLSHVM
jgi:hypothetical protein